MGRNSKEKIAKEKDLRERNFNATMAARGVGKRSDLTPMDQRIDDIVAQVGEGKFKSFDEAYDVAQAGYEKAGQSLPNRATMKGRALRRVDWLADLGKIDKSAYLKKLGIDETDLKSGYERFAGGAAQEINKLDYARGKLSRINQNMVDETGMPDILKKVYNFISPISRVLGEPETKQSKQLAEGVDKILTDEEKFWKGYNATEDVENERTGLDLPLNLAGGTGALLPDLLAGFGAGMVGKKVATQFIAEVGSSVAMEGAKYQMDGDADASISSVATDMLLNALTMRTGSALANTLDKTKAGRATSGAMTVGDTQAAIEAMNMAADGKTKIPSLLVSDPQKAVKNISKPKTKQEALDTKRAFDEAEATTAKNVDKALDDISPNIPARKSNVEDTQDIVAQDFVDQIEKTKAEFKSRAQPFTDAYQEVGKDMNIDLNEILKTASNITDPTALSRFEGIITSNINRINDVNKIKLLEAKGVKDLGGFRKSLAEKNAKIKAEFDKYGVKNIEEYAKAKGVGAQRLKEMRKSQKEVAKDTDLDTSIADLERKAKIGDRTSFSANDTDLIVQQIGEEIASNKKAMSSLSDSGLNQLTDIRTSLKGKLQELPKEFSVPYNKSKEIYSDMYKVTGKDTKLGDVSSAIKDYKTSGSLKGVRSLLNESPMLDNLSNYSSMLPKDSPAYKSIFREQFDNKLKGVRDAKGSSVFDFAGYGDAMKGINWEEVMRFAPKGSDDSIKTLSGYQSLIANMDAKGGDLLTNGAKRNEALDKSVRSGLFDPRTWGGTIKDSLLGNVPTLKPWHMETDIGIGSRVASEFNRLLPAGSREYIMESATKEAGYFKNQLNNLREANGMGKIVDEPIEPKVFDKLTNSDYDFKE